MSPPTSVDRILSRHSAVFEGIGKLSEYQLLVYTDPSVAPVAQPLQRTPFHVRKDIEKKLKELQHLHIIEDVDSPTPWVSPLVAFPKSNGDIRVCVDMHRVNEAILRDIRYQHLKRHCKTLMGLLSSLNLIFDEGIIRLSDTQNLGF